MHSQFGGSGKLQDVAGVRVINVEEKVLAVPVQLDRGQLVSYVRVR